MGIVDRPRKAPSRAWVLVLVLIALPILSALIVDLGNTTVLLGVTGSGLVLTLAVLAWAIQHARKQQRDFEERLAAWAAERAVQQERLRIARDLHDLSSHGLGTITVRAATTSYLDGPDADAARHQALLDIERMSRSTMGELRRMLTLLRSPEDEPAPLQPADTLATLPSIIKDAERSGLIIQLTIDNLTDAQDGLGELAQSVQNTICAIVREALTNVIRHAGPTTVRLSITQSTDMVNIVVDNDKKNPNWQSEPGVGQGLTGLRERIYAHGGTLTASPTPTGFCLEANLPVEGVL
ncbi:sensor histidine kinase [Stomatohabitans albus]|uniref:sensor histidine kinase n=1 Tax=Stomatohabitans albus TaxID=3110766 RepID=UPI00300C65B8